MDLSIIIPTYNRATLMAQAVRSAVGMDYPSDRYEVIVVDNASTDTTPEVVQRLQSHSNGYNLHYVREEQLGLHNARHAGARAAKGEILVFTDDDATFDPRWITAYAKAFSEHPEMVAAGGPVRPVWEVPPPQWLLDYMEQEYKEIKMLGLLSLMEPYEEFRLDPKGFFFGVNMAIRRDVLFEVGGFNPEAFGDIWLGDGETGLNCKLWERGMLIGYVPEAVVYHHIPPQRMTVDYFRRRMANEGACGVYARYHHGMPRRLSLCNHAATIVINNYKYWVAALLMNGRTDPRSLHFHMHTASTQSQFKYIVRLMFDQELRNLVLKDDWFNTSEQGLFAPQPVRSNMQVSVVIPTYNRSKMIQRAVQSVLAQSYTDLEVLVIDDGSTDDTADIVKECARNDWRIHLIQHSERKGAQAARNTGIRAARGQWIAFLDSDDEWLPESLEVRLRLAKERGLQVVHSDCYVLRAGSAQPELFGLPALQGQVYKELLERPASSFPGLLVSKQALARIGPLDETIVSFQEWDTVIRLAQYCELGFTPEATFIYDCRHRDTISCDLLRVANGYKQVFTKHWWPILRHLGPKALASHYHIGAHLYLQANELEGERRCSMKAILLWPFRPRAFLRRAREVFELARNKT
jgi:glycosyltransferase involved in cell wall biosynthesis